MHLHAARLLHESCSGYAGAEAVIEGDRRVACNFVSADREHLLLMPPSMADWLPEDRSGVVVPDVVAELDLSVFHAAYRLDGRGGACLRAADDAGSVDLCPWRRRALQPSDRETPDRGRCGRG
jgi:hypothetical protein